MSEATYFQTHQQTTLWLPIALKLALQGHCGAQGISMNKLITQLIQLWVTEQDTLAEIAAMAECQEGVEV